MRYLLDTNAVSELRKARTARINLNFSRWTETVDAGDLFLSAITLLEIERGILLLKRRDPLQAADLRKWFENLLLVEFHDRILPVDKMAALYCAKLHVPDQRSANDALIAATAFCNDMVVVTRNTKDFEGLGVTLLNPWLDPEAETPA